MEKLKSGEFEVGVKRDSFIVSRGDRSISMLPGEAANAVNILIRAMGLQKVKVFPEKISHTPFVVKFTPERVLYLARNDRKGEEVAFNFDEGDDLIKVIKDGSNKYKDFTTITPSPRGGPSHYSVPDPVIEGR